jgi:hypothetical protein
VSLRISCCYCTSRLNVHDADRPGGGVFSTRGCARAARRLGILGSIVGAVSLLLATGGPRPPKSIFGVYGRPAAGHDSIRVTERADGKIRVAIKLYYSNGHTCQLNDDGEWREDRLAIVAGALDPSHPCRLSIFFDKSGVLLRDEGFQCAPVYCGTRGKLDNVRLPKLEPILK